MFGANLIVKQAYAANRIALERRWDELRVSPRAQQHWQLISSDCKTYRKNNEDNVVLKVFKRFSARYDLTGLPSGHPPSFGVNAAPTLPPSSLSGTRT